MRQAAGLEGLTLGEPGEETCPDCGAVRVRELEECGGGVSVWRFPPHSCPERATRLAAEAAEAAREREEQLRNPSPGRIAAVRAKAQLPLYVPAGLDLVRAEEVSAAALARLQEHREAWLRGERPARGVWLYGDTNCRKTVLSGALLFDVAHRTGRHALCWNLEHLMGQLRREARGQESRYDRAAVEGADLLLLDDVGSVNVTESVYRVFYDLLESASACWGAEGPTQTLYVTSNESPAELEALYATRDDPQQGERIIRRLAQLCERIEVRRELPGGADIPDPLRQKVQTWNVGGPDHGR